MLSRIARNKFNNMEQIEGDGREKERGAALALSLIVLAILGVVSVSVLTIATKESNIMGSDLRRTQTFYAASASMEKMTNDFSDLFNTRVRPSNNDLNFIANSPPTELVNEGFGFSQSIAEDIARLNEMRASQGIGTTAIPRININEGPYAGLYATVIPYKMLTTATFVSTGEQVKLEREINNYQIPLFQFGIFSDEDIEIHPGPLMTYNGRVHANGNIYALRNTYFLSKVTTASEFIFDTWRGGATLGTWQGKDNVWMRVGGIDVRITKGSMQQGSGRPGGPNIPGTQPGQRGYFPDSPNGVTNPNWETKSVLPAQRNITDQFGGQLLTRTTGAFPLKLPVQLEGNNAAEIIKRSLPEDSSVLQLSRFHNKSQIRILIDDEDAGSGYANTAGIPEGKGVKLSEFNPVALDSGNALRRIDNNGNYLDPDVIKQDDPAFLSGNPPKAETVRGVRSYTVSDNQNANGNVPKTPNGAIIPPGAGIKGRILIEIVSPDGTVRDVTRTILSMGMTVGEPNAIVYLQRPLWAAYVQGSYDRNNGSNNLVYLTNSTRAIIDGEIKESSGLPSFDPTYGCINTAAASFDDELTTLTDTSATITRNRRSGNTWNQIVPINFYNVREGWRANDIDKYLIYERGLMTVVELNMRNLTRWLDSVYDNNLLLGTDARSENIQGEEGYIVYFSDRRGDRVKREENAAGEIIYTSNGFVDNEDIYGPNNTLDPGEDVINYGWDVELNAPKKGTLQKDTEELPDVGYTWSYTGAWSMTSSSVKTRAQTVMSYISPTRNYFRRSLRLFDGETLSITAATGKLSTTKGINISSENLVYIWGSYNTTGVASIPTTGSTLNDGGFLGPQVPAAIIADAFSPLSRTWFDALPVLCPQGSNNGSFSGTGYRSADQNVPLTAGTSMRAGVIAGTTISALDGNPSRQGGNVANGRILGGVINYPRFLELWEWPGNRAWSFSGSFVPMFRSTQAIGQWENSTAVTYFPPRRNWSFDDTFKDPRRLPPGTPFFQYVEPTGFRQKITG